MDVNSATGKTEFLHSKRTLSWILKIIIAAGLLIFIITVVDFNSIVNGIISANKTYLLISIVLLPVNLYLQYLKWKITVEYLLEEKDKNKICESLFLGFSAAVFTPARIGEYLGRAAAFKDKSLLHVTIAVVIDKFFSLLCIAFFGSIASVLFLQYYYQVTIYITIALFITIIFLFYLLALLLLNENLWDNILFNKIKSKPKLRKIFYRLTILKKLDKKFILKMINVSILFYLCFIMQYSLLTAAFSNKLNIIDYNWAGSLVMFAKTIIPAVSFGELGIREGASIFFITKIGEPAYVGLNASIFLFFINVLTPAVIGFFFLFRKNND